MYRRILVPIDGSPTSTQGLDEAIKLAKLTGASLRLMHVVDELAFATGFDIYPTYAARPGAADEAGRRRNPRAGSARVAASGIGVDTRLFETFATRVSELVVEQAKAWGADLIVIGTHGRRGVGRLLLGSDAEQIVRTAPVPVLLVRASQEQAAQPSNPAAAI